MYTSATPRAPSAARPARTEQIHFTRGQHGRGFVENQHAAIANQIPRDLDHLLMPDAQFAHERIGIDRVQSDLAPLRDVRILAQRRPVDPAEFQAFALGQSG